MLFVGRKREKKQIFESLREGKNIIIGGKFGIGRTSLIREIAKILADERKFVFVDFSKTPGEMSEKLMKELGLSARFKKTGTKMGYKSMRYRVANAKSLKKQNTVIVFDNIAKLTNQKTIFLRHLILEQHFQFIAIVEHFLPQKHFFELKVQLIPTATITLRYLKMIDVEDYLQTYSNQYHLNWQGDYIHDMVNLASGYPLRMTEILKKEREPRPLRINLQLEKCQNDRFE